MNRLNRTAMLAAIPLALSAAVPPPAQAQSLFSRVESAVPARVDTMYVKGLRHLQTTQKPDGSWTGQYGDEPGIVGFALMAFLAHGDEPNIGPYAPQIRKCIDFILSKQSQSTGYIGSSMYTHGFATLALAEAYGVVRDDRIGPALQKAVNLILTAQQNNALGGWRYSPSANDSDTTICGCQMMALFAARNAGLGIPAEAFAKAQKFMDSCRDAQGGYGYTTPGMRVTLSAIGSLVQSIGKNTRTPSYKLTVDLLKKNLNYREDMYPFYHEYYMAQALFHADEEAWKQWNAKNIRLLFASQLPDGSWPSSNSKAYSTTLALLSLAVNYRFLPIYEK